MKGLVFILGLFLSVNVFAAQVRLIAAYDMTINANTTKQSFVDYQEGNKSITCELAFDKSRYSREIFKGDVFDLITDSVKNITIKPNSRQEFEYELRQLSYDGELPPEIHTMAEFGAYIKQISGGSLIMIPGAHPPIIHNLDFEIRSEGTGNTHSVRCIYTGMNLGVGDLIAMFQNGAFGKTSLFKVQAGF